VLKWRIYLCESGKRSEELTESLNVKKVGRKLPEIDRHERKEVNDERLRMVIERVRREWQRLKEKVKRENNETLDLERGEWQRLKERENNETLDLERGEWQRLKEKAKRENNETLEIRNLLAKLKLHKN
jgi:hypothetical protein